LFLIQDEPGGANRSCWELIVKMQAGESMSLAQIQAFLESSEEVEFKAGNKEDLYEWVNQTLRQLDYGKLKRSGRGLVRRYVAKMTGLSRAQATRLLGMYLRGEAVRPKPYRRRRFVARYPRADAELLATVDEAHDTLSGPGHAEDFATGALRVPRRAIPAPGGVVGGAVVPHAEEPRLPSAVHQLPADAARRNKHRRAAPARAQMAGPATCAWTRCIKETKTESRGCTTSTQWTK
jgi:hypothetical protein